MLATKPEAHCHKILRDVAQEAAGQLYETVMGDNEVRAEWKRRWPNLSDKALERRFIARYWGHCLPFARATLATMLSPGHVEGLDPAAADAIMEALVLDSTLRRGRGQQGQVLGRSKF